MTEIGKPLRRIRIETSPRGRAQDSVTETQS
jgi:hypothetical protein